MLESAIIFTQDEFTDIKTQITFLAPIEKVTAVLRENFIKWDVQGQGEAWGYWLKLKSNNKPLIIKTFAARPTTLNGAIRPVEWCIDAESLEVALQVFSELETQIDIQTWRYW